MPELVYHNIIDLPKEDSLMITIAALFTNIPILMIYLSRVLPTNYNKISNVAAALFTLGYIISGSSTTPHYIIIATIETVFLILIIYTTLKWDLKSEII
jgi:hypothetical protein